MDQDDEKRQRTQPVAEYRREVRWGVVIPTAAMVITLFTTGHGVIMGLVDRIVAIDRVAAANAATHINRAAELAALDTRLTRLSSRVETCATSLAELQALSRRGTFASE
jgi:hypothetical protein